MNKHILLVLVLTSVVSTKVLSQNSADVDLSVQNGKLIYEQSCLACHQADGSGVPNLAPPLIKGVFVAGDKKRLIEIVLQGLQDVEIRGEYYANPMPAFDYLSDQEVADVLTYVRSNFTNDEESVSAEEVKQTRNRK